MYNNIIPDNPKEYKIAAVMIIGDDFTERNWERVSKSLEGYVDGLYVSFNGTKDQYPEYIPDIEDFVWNTDFVWDDNFAAARNHSFSLVPLEKYSFCLWIDLDDELQRGEELQPMLNSLKHETQSVMMNYVYATDPTSGDTHSIQGRERLFRTDLVSAPGAGWVHELHETFMFPPGTQLARKTDEDKDPYILHHKQEQFEDGKDAASRERNRRILTKMLTNNPNDTRARFYFANELYAEAAEALNNGEPLEYVEVYCNKAIQAYDVFMEMVDNQDEAYVAAHQIAELYKFKNAFLESVEADFQAVMIYADWPDAWVGIANSYMYMEQWDKAIFYAKVALELCITPNTVLIREPLNAEWTPKSILATCYEQIGETEKAEEILLGFQEKLGENKNEELEEAINRLRATVKEEYVEPEPTLREKNWGTQPEKSICFFSRPGVEPWSTKSMDEGGIGGTETAVCEIAKRFAADGWRTVIFGSPPEELHDTVYDGIEWYNTLEISTTEPFTIMVSLRTPELFDADIKADLKVLWMHDVNTGDNFIDEFGNNRSNNIDYIAGVSDWHCSHLQKLYDIPEEKLITLPNGINLERFLGEEVIERQKNKFIWSSSPDRGLDIVLDLWPDIRKIAPDAELHIFYGWNNFDEMTEATQDPYMKRFSAQMKAAIEGMKDQGVVARGRISQNELAKEFLSADYWPYLSQFLETNCISILEAQAAGCTPFYSPIGGITENASTAAFPINGMPMNFTYREEFLEKLQQIVDTPEENRRGLRLYGALYAQDKSWDKMYEKWEDVVQTIEDKIHAENIR